MYIITICAPPPPSPSPPLLEGRKKSGLGNWREESHPNGNEKRKEGKRERSRGKKDGKERGRKGTRERRKRVEREDTCNSCHHFYIIYLVLENDLQIVISH